MNVPEEQKDSAHTPTLDGLAFCDAFAGEGFIDLFDGNADDEGPTDGPWSEALPLAPLELQDALQKLETDWDKVDLSPQQTQQSMEALQEVFIWITTTCTPGLPVRYFAPDHAPEGWVSCGDTSWFPGGDRVVNPGWTMVYGDPSHSDPYSQPLIAVLTGTRLSPGDGPNTPVLVNGAEASAGPASVFQGVTSPELAYVISWVLDGNDVTVLGRGYDEEQIPQLIAIAEAVIMTNGHASLSDDQLALGGDEINLLYSGTNEPLISLSPLFAPARRYSLNYQLAPPPSSTQPNPVVEQYGVLHIESFIMTVVQFDASRAFFAEVEQREFHGQPGYVARAWHEGGPFIVSWRYPDDTVIRVVSLGIDLEPDVARRLTIDVAESTVEHNPEQWNQVSRPDVACFRE